MRDRVVRAEENVIRLLAVVVDRFARDLGDRAAVVARWHSRHATHVAVLALDALLARRRRAVLLPHDFQLDAGVDGDLMAGRAELAAREGLEVDARDVNVLARAGLLRRGLHFELVFLGDCLGDAVAADAAEDRRR